MIGALAVHAKRFNTEGTEKDGVHGEAELGRKIFLLVARG